MTLTAEEAVTREGAGLIEIDGGITGITTLVSDSMYKKQRNQVKITTKKCKAVLGQPSGCNLVASEPIASEVAVGGEKCGETVTNVGLSVVVQ